MNKHIKDSTNPIHLGDILLLFFRLFFRRCRFGDLLSAGTAVSPSLECRLGGPALRLMDAVF